jgi:hypothetical protein
MHGFFRQSFAVAFAVAACGSVDEENPAPDASDGSGGTSGGGTACKIGGVVYPNGTDGIQDPFSCNKCSCASGQLACTRIGCPIPCPVGTQASQQCAECGPVDNCNVVEHGCLPTCEAGNCSGAGSCIGGVCRMVCG